MSKINYDGFNANSARHITKEAQKNELQRTIDSIIEFSEKNESAVAIMKALSNSTIETLKKRGFKVEINKSVRMPSTFISW